MSVLLARFARRLGLILGLALLLAAAPRGAEAAAAAGAPALRGFALSGLFALPPETERLLLAQSCDCTRNQEERGSGNSFNDDPSTRIGGARGPLFLPGGGGGGDAVATRLDAINAFCSALPEIYRIDCLIERYSALVQSLPWGGPYGEVKQILGDTVRELNGVVARYADTTAAPIRPTVRRGASSSRSSRPLVPVRADASRAANAAAAAILEEASTRLLRSAENSERRAVNFQRIAQAVDSSKVLLRSA
jgi:hypothetical protein